jgi:hypothetical protein
VGNGHISAYTLKPGEFELSGSLMRVNDTIDFLDLREELLSANTRLIGNSGDLDGSGVEIRVGVWRGLELYYSHQQQDMTLKVSGSAQIDVVDLDQKLRTTSKNIGAKWVFYEQPSLSQSSPGISAALDIRQFDNSSRDFGGFIERVRLNANTNISFSPPQRFSMDRLADDGWQARLIASAPIGERTAISAWLGYGSSSASSGTSTEIEFQTIQQAFLQTFDIREQQYMAGISVNFQQFQRLPIQIGYEYTNINSRQQDIVSSNSTLIPTFLRGRNLANSADKNHTVYGTASWWLTPRIYSSVSGKLFRNQFVGIMPHFNNPLSASFSETMYGFVELKIGIKLSR